MAEDLRARLETTRDTLRRELAELTAAPRDPMGTVSFGKRVGEGTNQAIERITQVDAAKKLDAKLRDVERALAKLDEGTYGVCDSCGEPIGTERLEAIPWATLCVRCASAR
ncbi:MAG TPA: TraR/DksA family transcriptional regulator [Actinomycetota bacterium]|nr:TraR/DksA family transcriptional regulator [Actinomycetota bacterium]